MATWYISPTGSDSTGDGSQGSPWKTTDKAQGASVSAGDTVTLLAGTYLATTSGSIYAQGFHNWTKPLLWVASGAVTLTGADSNYVSRISSGMAAGTLTFTGIIFDALNTSIKCFEVGDMTTKVWAVTHTSCQFKNGTAKLYDLLLAKGGSFTTVDCAFYGRPTASGFIGITGNATMGASNNLTITHTRPVFNLISTTDLSGVSQDCAAVSNTVAYIIDGATGTIGTTSITSSVIGIQLRCSGGSVINSDNLIISAPDTNNSSAYGIKIYPNAINVSDVLVKNNRVQFLAPGGYGITIGDSTTVGAGTVTGGELSGNWVSSKHYATATPHAIAVGRSTALTKITGNLATDAYVGMLFSEATSGTAYANTTRDIYGSDYYAKANTAITISGNTAIQTGKYARINLAPFSIDSQGGTATTATTFSNNTFICLETDFTRVGSLGNITINQPGTMSGNVYQLPSTIAASTTAFYVGGAEGGRVGATGYTITQWLTGTAGSVSATNGTGTISVSGAVFLPTSLAQLKTILSGISPGRPLYSPGYGVVVAL